jgi:hypothetical protein
MGTHTKARRHEGTKARGHEDGKDVEKSRRPQILTVHAVHCALRGLPPGRCKKSHWGQSGRGSRMRDHSKSLTTEGTEFADTIAASPARISSFSAPPRLREIPRSHHENFHEKKVWGIRRPHAETRRRGGRAKPTRISHSLRYPCQSQTRVSARVCSNTRLSQCPELRLKT